MYYKISENNLINLSLISRIYIDGDYIRFEYPYNDMKSGHDVRHISVNEANIAYTKIITFIKKNIGNII